MSFEELGLSPELLRAVADRGYSIPTPVQRLAIPAILDGRDVMTRAQTGTGKTAGFTLPLLQRLSSSASGRRRRKPRALILTPTRELAAQVRESVVAYGRHLPLSSVVVFGGIGFGPQARALRGGTDLLIATPGRLLDHLSQRTVDLSAVESLVLDEADRMLDMGFIPDVKRILGVLPSGRQTLLFSATFPPAIRKLADELLKDPKRIEIAPTRPTAEGISQLVHPVDRHRKTALLSHCIRSEAWKRVLVFTRTKRGADRLTRRLQQDRISSVAIHGDKTQSARTRALADFKRGTSSVLVATDIAARGLDIEKLPRVVNFELPHTPEDYIHRIGRTGRANREGQAISLVSPDENELLQGIERLLKRDLPRAPVVGFEPSLTRGSDSHGGRGSTRRKRAARGSGWRKRVKSSGPRSRGSRKSKGARSVAAFKA